MNNYTLLMPIILSVITISGCDKPAKKEVSLQVNALTQDALKNMVFVEGGEFLMGDFGLISGEEKGLPYSFNSDDKYLHKVTLDSFSIGKYKVTYGDFDIYTTAVGKEKTPGPKYLMKRNKKVRASDMPAAVTWQEAKDYCLWFGQQSGHRIDLPTEAQWEYAARSRGQYLPYATDNGKLELGRNIPSDEQMTKMMGGYSSTYPIGLYPANPLGLYDMGFNGRDWINDWYSADYYKHSPEHNPQGPDQGTLKIIRGYTSGDYSTGLTMLRQNAKPIPVDKNDSYENEGILPSFVFRCVMNSTDKK